MVPRALTTHLLCFSFFFTSAFQSFLLTFYLSYSIQCNFNFLVLFGSFSDALLLIYLLNIIKLLVFYLLLSHLWLFSKFWYLCPRLLIKEWNKTLPHSKGLLWWWNYVQKSKTTVPLLLFIICTSTLRPDSISSRFDPVLPLWLHAGRHQGHYSSLRGT